MIQAKFTLVQPQRPIRTDLVTFGDACCGMFWFYRGSPWFSAPS